MSQSVLQALKNIDPKSTATKWVIPGKKTEPAPPKKEEPKPTPVNNELSNKSEPAKKDTNSSEKNETKVEQKEETISSPENTVNSDKVEEKEEPAPQEKEEPAPQQKEEPVPQQKEEPAPQQKEEPAPQEKEEPVPQQKEEPTPQEKEEPTLQQKEEPAPKPPASNPALNRMKSEPAPDFKRKLEEIHSKPNRPGVIAQHEFNYQEPPEKHASYTQLQKKSTWAGPAPKTFGQKVDWLQETGEFHYYQYKQPERKNYNDYQSTQTNRNTTEGPSERKVGVDPNAVPTKSKFSALLSVYNGGQ